MNLSVSNIAVVNNQFLYFCLGILKELYKILNVFIKMHVFQMKRVKLILVHFNELCDKVRPKEALVNQLQTANIVVLEVGFIQTKAFAGLEVRKYKFFYKQVFSALLLNCLFKCLTDVIVAGDNEIFNKIVLLKEINKLLSKLVIQIVVLYVQIKQV